MITIDLSILNQKGTPMFYSDVFAARPPFGIAGRIFISTDTKEFYRDTGTAWELLGGPGTGTITGGGTATQVAFFNSATSIAGNNDLYWDNVNSRLGIGNNNPAVNLDIHGNNATIQIDGRSTSSAFVQFVTQGVSKWRIGNLSPSNYFQIYDNANSLERLKIENTGLFTLTGNVNNNATKTAVSNDGWYGLYTDEVVSIPASTTFTGGNSFGSITGNNKMTFAGNATMPNSAVPAGILSSNVFTFSNALTTLTINQATGTRAISAVTAFNQVNTIFGSTITHLAGFQVLAPYSQNGTLTATNYFGLLINASDERAGFTITNKWGIYQEGSNDRNYLNGTTLIGTNVDTLSGAKLQVTGAATFTSNVTANSFIKVGGTSTQYLMADGSTSTLTSPITGSGTANWVARFTGTNAIGLSNIFDNNTFVGVFTATDNLSGAKLQVNGAATFSSTITATRGIFGTTGTGTFGVHISDNDQSNVRLRFTNTGTGGQAFSLVGGNPGASNAGFAIYDETNAATRLYISSTGAATFSSTITSNDTYGLTLGSVANKRRIQYGSDVATSFTFLTDANGYAGIYAGGAIFNSNVGIGATPSAWTAFNPVLQVKTGSLAGSGTANFRMFANTYYDGSYRYIGTGTATQYEQDGYHAWYTAPSGTAGNAITFTQRMTLDASGNLGIGLTSPVARLQVVGANGAGLRIDQGNYNYYGAFTHQWLNSGFTSTFMTLDNSGRLGIGTTSPAAVLEVAGTSATTDFRISRTVSSSTYLSITAPGGSPSTSIIGINGSNVMALNSSGRVLIGTTTDNATGTLQVTGASTFSSDLYLNDSGHFIFYTGTFIPQCGMFTSGTDLVFFTGTFAEAFRVVSTGIQTQAPTASSAVPWKLGNVSVVSPTSPNRTIAVEVNGTTYYIHAKTTNN